MGKGMKAGKRPKMNKGMDKNLQISKLQAMQREMEETQKALAEKEITETAGGGAVSVTVSGDKEIKSLKISKEVVDADDVEMLEDLIIACTNEALRQVDAMTEQEMSKFTGGMSFPGM